jgi:predicted peptidase
MSWQQLYERRTYKDCEKSLPYRLLKPKDYDPFRKYPLVLYLHGAAQRGTDNNAHLCNGVEVFTRADARAKHPCFVVVPQCPPGESWVKQLGRTSPKPTEPLRMAVELIGSLGKEFGIDASRQYVTGISLGGFGTWEALVHFPTTFAAGVPVCGGGDLSTAAAIAKTPVWVFHGKADQAVPVILEQQMVRTLQKAGGQPKYTEYPLLGHECWNAAYNEPGLLDWLFQQKRDAASTQPTKKE